MDTNAFPPDDHRAFRAVSMLKHDEWVERRRALSSVIRWLRAQDSQGAFEARPAHARTFLEAFQLELLEQFRWEESLQFPRLRSRLGGYYSARVEAAQAEHEELRLRLAEVVDEARAGECRGELSIAFGAKLRCFLDALHEHSGREAQFCGELGVRFAGDPREWPGGPGRSSWGS